MLLLSENPKAFYKPSSSRINVRESISAQFKVLATLLRTAKKQRSLLLISQLSILKIIVASILYLGRSMLLPHRGYTVIYIYISYFALALLSSVTADGLPLEFIKQIAASIAKPFANIFNLSLMSAEIPH